MIVNAKGAITLITACFLSFACTTNKKDDWVAQCEKSVGRLSNKQSNNITYTPLPSLKQDASFLSLSWSGLNIPIPDTAYSDVLINTEKNDDLAIILVTRDGARISVGRVYGNDKLNSLFEVMSESPSTEETEWTKGTFDKPVRTSDLTDLAYQTILNDINCKAANQADESVKLTSLVLKSVAPKLNAVHKLKMNEKNWVDVRDDFFANNKKSYTVNIVDSARNSDEIKQISYSVADKVDNFSLYAGISKSDITIDNPAWLTALNKALETKTKENWILYFAEAKKANISDKTLTASKSALNLK